MGLSLSHGDYSRSYSSLNFMRNYMMQRAGYTGTEKVSEGFLPFKYWSADINWDEIPDSAVQGDWGDHVPKDILFVLACHSDCEYSIKRKHLKPLADRMREILAMPEKEHYVHCYTDIQLNIEVAECFIDSLLTAHKARQILRFL